MMKFDARVHCLICLDVLARRETSASDAHVLQLPTSVFLAASTEAKCASCAFLHLPRGTVYDKCSVKLTLRGRSSAPAALTYTLFPCLLQKLYY